ncbi:MAG: hypothetical protein OEZ31_02950 [Nitrospirota bacterium]|nr:hypothetical protein [Nitrospirota bacterium]
MTFILSVFLLFVFPSNALSDVIVHDMVMPQGEEMMLRAETKGKIFSKGGERVEFFVEGKSIGKTLSGGDGFAFKQFTPLKTGIHRITVTSGIGEGNGLLLSLKKGTRIVFIDVEGSLLRGPFSKEPRQGSQKAIKEIYRKFTIVFLQTGLLNVKTLKAWLKENKFIEVPVIPWGQGSLFDDIHKKGFKIKAIIGSEAVIESAKGYKPLAFSFEGGEDAKEVKDWEEIQKKLK